MDPNCFKATYQGDEVWFIPDDSYRQGLRGDSIVYTLEEAELLAQKSEWTRRIVHEAKKRAARLVSPPKQPNSKERHPGDTTTQGSCPSGRMLSLRQLHYNTRKLSSEAPKQASVRFHSQVHFGPLLRRLVAHTNNTAAEKGAIATLVPLFSVAVALTATVLIATGGNRPTLTTGFRARCSVPNPAIGGLT